MSKSKKPASASVVRDGSITMELVAGIFQALGTMESPKDIDDVPRVVEVLRNLWLDKPQVMLSVPNRQNGIMVRVDILAKQSDGKGLEIFRRTVDGLVRTAPHKLENHELFHRAINILQEALPSHLELSDLGNEAGASAYNA